MLKNKKNPKITRHLKFTIQILTLSFPPLHKPHIDVDDVKYVINFDYPHCSEDYVHRIGRTGRCDKTGTAYTFFTQDNMKQANELISVLKEATQVVNPKLYEMSEMAKSGFGGKGEGFIIISAEGVIFGIFSC